MEDIVAFWSGKVKPVLCFFESIAPVSLSVHPEIAVQSSIDNQQSTITQG
jgi:hypothetical protein